MLGPPVVRGLNLLDVLPARCFNENSSMGSDKIDLRLKPLDKIKSLSVMTDSLENRRRGE